MHQGQAIFQGVDGDSAHSQLIGGAENTDGDFAAIGSQYFADGALLFHRKPSARLIGAVRNFTLCHGETDSADCFFQCSGTEILILVPFQLVPANPFENTLSVFASDARTVIWPKELERR